MHSKNGIIISVHFIHFLTDLKKKEQLVISEPDKEQETDELMNCFIWPTKKIKFCKVCILFRYKSIHLVSLVSSLVDDKSSLLIMNFWLIVNCHLY